VIKRTLAACAVTVGISACAPAVQQAPVVASPGTPAANTIPAAIAPSAPLRPRHKGGVDLSTGLYGREDDDLVLNTAMPIVLRRTYNSGDNHSRQFGLDWTHSGEWWLYGDGDPRIPWADLILASGTRIHFVRTSPGQTQQDAVLRHDSSPTEFNGALLSWTGSLWEMRFRDGSIARFLDCNSAKEVCSLVERLDSHGHRTAYVRDAAGTLLKIESDGQSIAFDYDGHKRIVRAYDTLHREVSYRYDDRGRLVRATSSDGTVREYAYDERDKLIGIREPNRIIRNWFDESGHWIRQVLKDSDEDPDPYVAEGHYVVENGSVIESAFDEGDGLTVTRYNKDHYIVSETLDADGPAPIVFVYERDSVSNEKQGATMSCRSESGRITRAVPVESADNDALKEQLAHSYCRRR
jgi:YD repeat-containing protein